MKFTKLEYICILLEILAAIVSLTWLFTDLLNNNWWLFIVIPCLAFTTACATLFAVVLLLVASWKIQNYVSDQHRK